MPRKRRGGSLGRLTPNAKRIKVSVASPMCDQQIVEPSNNYLSQNSETAETNLDNLHFKCKVCNKVFTKNSSLKRHLNTHNVLKDLYNCTYCEEKFSRKDNFERHVKLHIEKKIDQYNCTYCEEKFSRKDNFDRHVTAHKENDQLMFICTYCELKFSRKDNFERHVNSHEVK